MPSSSSSTKTESSSTTPWAPQGAALTSAFQDAQNAYGKSSSAVAPSDFVAQFNPDQLATFKSMLGYANGNTDPSTMSATGNTLQNAGTAATTGALSGLSNYDPTKLNNTSSIVDAANQYVNGQDIGAQTNKAMQAAREQARDVTMPGIEQNAQMTGNTNSSRTGIANGLVERSLAENGQDTYNALRSSAFKDGLALASSNATSNNADKLGALSTAAGAGTNAATAGVNAGTAGITNQGALYGLSENAGQGEQAASQANLDNQAAKYQSDVNSPYAGLSQLMSIIGSQSWGQNSTGTSTTESTPSAWQVVGGLLGGAGNAASMAGGLGWKPFGS